jgi:COP9 signalosome complex subunit 4
MSLSERIGQITRAPDAKHKVEGYEALINEVFTAQNTADAKTLAQHILGPELALVEARQVLSAYSRLMSKLQNDPLLAIGTYVLEQLTPKVKSFEEEDAKIREQVAEVLTAKRDFYTAARTLAAINLESSTRSVPVAERAAKYVQIAELFLEADDSVSAESYIGRASMIIHLVTDVPLTLRHRVCYARVLDSRREFLQAARSYFALSQEGSKGVAEGDLLHLLTCASTCTVLASAGPQRARLLASLFKDDRTQHLEHFEMLHKIYNGHLLRKPEIQKFASSLLPHQQAKLSNGLTVLEKAVIEHNIVAISRLYISISFEEMGALLEITSQRAEQIIANMVAENRIAASLDQLNAVVEFESGSESIGGWTQEIAALCSSIDRMVEQMLEA